MFGRHSPLRLSTTSCLFRLYRQLPLAPPPKNSPLPTDQLQAGVLSLLICPCRDRRQSLAIFFMQTAGGHARHHTRGMAGVKWGEQTMPEVLTLIMYPKLPP